MRPYQEEYLALLRSVPKNPGPSLNDVGPEAFADTVRRTNAAAREALRQGTQLLREGLFPVLDDILTASQEDLDGLKEFADKLISGREIKDVGLNYRIHLALLSYARHRGGRDMLIRELYHTAMGLYNLDYTLIPNTIRLFSTRMRMYFSESASYFDTQYDDIQDPETRGFIHRSMGNIAMGYSTQNPEGAVAKLAAIDRSIRILSDPDIRAKTPSLPWDLYLYKSHQERTTMLNYLRSGRAGPEAFAQVLESAQIVQNRQLQAARERGEPLQPRWQYAYMAARYHCGAMDLRELLEGFYALSTARPDDDFSDQSLFAHVGIPAYYLEYSKQIRDDRMLELAAEQAEKLTRRVCGWIDRVPGGYSGEQLMMHLRQFLYVYREFPGGMPFFDLLQSIFAARDAAGYVRMWIAGRIARQLCLWTVEEHPEQLIGMLGCRRAEDVTARRKELLDFAAKAGRLYDTGMLHFSNLEALTCRGLFEEEESLFRLHTHCGAVLLADHSSTAPFADIARGHHRWYDEKGGFPLDFSLRDCPVRPMVCIVAAADALASSTEEGASRFRPVEPLDTAVRRVIEGGGRQYAPFIAELLKSPQRQEQLRTELPNWQREAYMALYRYQV